MSSPLEAVAEEDEEPEIENAPIPALFAAPNAPAAELDNLPTVKDSRNAMPTTAAAAIPKGRVFQPPEPRLTAKEKGKNKEPAANRVRGTAGTEKENDAKRSKTPVLAVPAKAISSAAAGPTHAKPVAKVTSVTVSRPRLMAKLPPGTGARRVPVGSVEAAVPVGRGWKG
jgi:hypothetical protein